MPRINSLFTTYTDLHFQIDTLDSKLDNVEKIVSEIRNENTLTKTQCEIIDLYEDLLNNQDPADEFNLRDPQNELYLDDPAYELYLGDEQNSVKSGKVLPRWLTM